MPAKILKILLKPATKRSITELLEEMEFIKSATHREFKYYMTIDYYFWKLK